MVSRMCTLIQILVVVSLATIIATPPTLLPATSQAENICREQINTYFGSLTDYNLCVKNAFLHLYSGSDILAKNFAAARYFHMLGSHVHPGQALIKDLGFKQFCNKYNKDKNILLKTMNFASTSQISEIFSIDNCKDTLETFFARRNLQQTFKIIYNEECVDIQRYNKLYPALLTNPDFPSVVIRFVVHVSENFVLNSVPKTAIEFCRANIKVWNEAASKGTL